ncbi:hypothetical protein BDN70DRAFT_392856 [Pholiota conissans]|uniref:Uncharacterized protein n=1 Tax=Pholiota conissans TaxID=109636 RepID=A0A9P6D467_9AGAR|nr:hypothetical protein BDN70DRAFT_392856 [Pholiota conissans]
MGEKSIKVLAEHGITSFESLRKQSPLKIETLLNRRPPFGLDVLASIADLPCYTLAIKETAIYSDGGKSPVQVDLVIECGLLEQKLVHSSKAKKQRMRAFQTTAVLTLTSDCDLIDLRRIPTKALKGGKSFKVTAELTKPSQSVIVVVTSALQETIAGVVSQHLYKPSIPSSEYPVLDTRPISSIDLDLVGLEDDPDFWNMTLDSSSALGAAKSEIMEDLEDTKKPSKQDESLPIEHPVIEGPNHKVLEAKVRSDGTYECNHTCHNSQETTAKPVSNIQRLRVHPQISAPSKAELKIIKNLDSIHERTQVAQNLQLAAGKRLKLESSRPSKRKIRAPAGYDISFTQLADPEPVKLVEDFSDNDSEDLPEAIIPLPKFSKERQGRIIDNQHSTPVDEKFESSRPNKRIKSDQADMSSSSSTREEYIGLFLDTSDSDSSIEIVIPTKTVKTYPVIQQPPNGVIENENFQETNSLILSNPGLNGDTFAIDNVQNLGGTFQEHRVEIVDDEFAELDAWLQSESVDIL